MATRQLEEQVQDRLQRRRMSNAVLSSLPACGPMATIAVYGDGFGESINEIELVAVGARVCEALSLSTTAHADGVAEQVLTISCDISVRPVYGHISIRTVHGGRGTSCAIVSAGCPKAGTMSKPNTNATQTAKATLSSLGKQTRVLKQLLVRLPGNATFATVCTSLQTLLIRLAELGKAHPSIAPQVSELVASIYASTSNAQRAEWVSRCLDYHEMDVALNRTADTAARLLTPTAALSKTLRKLLADVKAAATLPDGALASAVIERAAAAQNETRSLIEFVPMATRLNAAASAVRVAIDNIDRATEARSLT